MAKAPYGGQQVVKYFHIVNRTAKELSDTPLLSFLRGNQIGLSAVIPTAPNRLPKRKYNFVEEGGWQKAWHSRILSTPAPIGGRGSGAIPVADGYAPAILLDIRRDSKKGWQPAELRVFTGPPTRPPACSAVGHV